MAHAFFLLDCCATLAMTKVLAVQGNNKSASPQATHKNVLRADLFTGLPRCAMLARNETERYAKVAARTKSADDTFLSFIFYNYITILHSGLEQ